MAFTFGSLFAGIGGFDCGLEQSGMTCQVQVEIDPPCRRVLNHHWPDVKRMKDVRKAKIEKGSVRLLCGGFPCQDLSVAGRRAGLAGKRSGLFFAFARIIAEVRPRWVLVENVPGLLSSDGGRDMGTVLGTLGELGYGWAYRSLDSQFFGLAQRRERVFIVGRLGNAALAAKVLFEHESCERNPPTGREKRADVAATIRGRSHGTGSNAPGRGGEDDVNLVAATLNSGGHDGGFRTEPGEHLTLARCLTSGEGKRQDGESCNLVTDYVPKIGNSCRTQDRRIGQGFNQTMVAFNVIGGGQNSRKHAYETERTGAIQGKGNSASGNEAGTVIAFQERGREGGRCLGMQNDLAYSLMSPKGGGRRQELNIATRTAVRRLTPTECLRLQGFPDDWLDLDPPLSDSAKYKMTGNAVSVPVAKWIGSRIIAADSE